MTSRLQLLLNADVGEGLPTDTELFPYLDQASIACGGHAGDSMTMHQAVVACKKHNVMIGAHPSYPDKENFGRVSIPMQAEELKQSIQAQIHALRLVCSAEQATLSYVKPHGALYNDLAKNTDLYLAVLEVLADEPEQLPLMIGARPDLESYKDLATKLGVTLIKEAFADRQYLDNGQLSPRSNPEAVHSDGAVIVQQCRQLVEEGKVTTESNKSLSLEAESLCLHGDNPASIGVAAEISALLHASN